MVLLTGLSVMISSCSKDEDDHDSILTVNGVESTDITFPGVFDNKNGIDFKHTVQVYSNENWSISGKPEWLNISPSTGKGNLEMVIYPISENTTSSPRTAIITLNCGEKTATINITQEAGKPVCYVDIANEVVLHDCVCWEYTATSNVNTFQYILLTEQEYNRLTDNEIEEIISKEDEMKFNDEYLSAHSYDNNGEEISPNTTYYVITLATDESGRKGELRKTKLETPAFKDATEDAWVSFANIGSDILEGFWFDTIKEGYCNTYHLIYGTTSEFYNKAVYAFEINYYLKYKKKHWLAENMLFEIVTDYPNNHTFKYSSLDLLYGYTICNAYAWGIFEDGTLSSDIIGISFDASSQNNVMKKVNSNSRKKENMLIRRSVVQRSVAEMRH